MRSGANLFIQTIFAHKTKAHQNEAHMSISTLRGTKLTVPCFSSQWVNVFEKKNITILVM